MPECWLSYCVLYCEHITTILTLDCSELNVGLFLNSPCNIINAIHLLFHSQRWLCCVVWAGDVVCSPLTVSPSLHSAVSPQDLWSLRFPAGSLAATLFLCPKKALRYRNTTFQTTGGKRSCLKTVNLYRDHIRTLHKLWGEEAGCT